MATEDFPRPVRSRAFRGFESEPSDEWREDYGRGGPIRSDEPERDWFFENSAAPPPTGSDLESVDTPKAVAPAAGRASEQGTSPLTYRGRGPKGYRPSDARILEVACERLTEHPTIDASDLTVIVKDGELTISGHVPVRAMKRAAEVAIGSIHGVGCVRNEIRVRTDAV